jgi:uncharacterized phage-associated protein
MKPRFREDKTTEAAVYLVNRHGGRMSYMKLIKLLYLADRECLLAYGRPITFDAYFSLPHGPVLSQTLNIINEGPRPGETSVWTDHISEPQNYDVEVIRSIEPDHLSEAEIEVLDRVYEEHGRKEKWALVDELHDILPEWSDPAGSSLPIRYEDILKAGNLSEQEIASIQSDIESIAFLESLQ